MQATLKPLAMLCELAVAALSSFAAETAPGAKKPAAPCAAKKEKEE